MSPDGEHRRDQDTGFYRAIDSLQHSAETLSHTVALVDKNQAVLTEKLNGHTDNKLIHGVPPCPPLEGHLIGHKKYNFMIISALLTMVLTLLLSLGSFLLNVYKNMNAPSTPPVVTPK